MIDAAFVVDGKEYAFAWHLATAKSDVFLEWVQLKFSGFIQDRLRSLFRELEFTDLIKLLDTE